MFKPRKMEADEIWCHTEFSHLSLDGSKGLRSLSNFYVPESVSSPVLLGGGFKYVLFSPLLEEMIQFD